MPQPVAVRHLTRQFDADWTAVLAIEVTDALARSAGALAEKHRLRAGDAIHLASFEEVLSRAGEQEVSAGDEARLRAARRLG